VTRSGWKFNAQGLDDTLRREELLIYKARLLQMGQDRTDEDAIGMQATLCAYRQV